MSEAGHFAVVTSNRLDRLVEHLAEQLVRSPLPPLEQEVVIVQSQGMQRWLTLELARHHGVAACLTTPFPRPFCRHLLRQLRAETRLPPNEEIPRQDSSDFGRERMLWRLVEILHGQRAGADLSAADAPDAPPPLAAPLAYLQDDGDQRKLYQLASRLAGLFDDYQLYRGEMLASWESPRELAGVERWQAELWRSLASADEESPAAATSGSPRRADEPLDRALGRLIRRLHGADRPPPGLPRRLAVLGVASLPPVFIDLLVALGRFLPVTAYIVSPTYHYWGDLRSERETARLARRFAHRDVSAQYWTAGHPLLASLGKQGRELFELLQRADAYGDAWHELDFEEPEGQGALAVLQRDVLHLIDRGAPDREEEPAALDPADESLTLHICHSEMREMQVLRHQLLRAFDQLPDLRPSDVLVLVPDMERYGPYIQAVFGASRELALPYLPFSIADRGAGREQPPSEIVLRLLELASARLTLREIFDLLETPAVRRAFGLGEDDLPTLRRLCRDAGVRWALSAEHKERFFDLPGRPENTWRAGLDRLLMGYAVGRLEGDSEGGSRREGDSLAAGVAPWSGDTAGLAETVGRFAELLGRLEENLLDLRRRRPLGEWASTLQVLVDDFFLAESEEEERGLQLVRDVAHDLASAAERVHAKAPLSLQVLREHLGSALAVDGFGSGFLNGQITFCALRPMRTIPFRVICLCGLDAGVFPRRDRRPGFDLMASQPRPGDRSVREDDRYLFLETLLAARDRLVITHVGRSQQDGSERQPSAVVSELMEHLDRSFRPLPDGRSPRQLVTRVHPLQPWSPSYFDGRDARLVSYAPEQMETASRLREPRLAEPPLMTVGSRLETADDEEPRRGPIEIPLRDFQQFWRSPSRWFCQQTLGLGLEVWEEQEHDAEPMVLQGLDGFAVRRWLVERRLEDRAAGVESDPEVERRLLTLRGELPPAALAPASLEAAGRRVEAFLRHVPEYRPAPPSPLGLIFELPGDDAPTRRRLIGTLDSRAAGDGSVLRFRCGELRPVDWLETWIEHLVSACLADHGPLPSLLVGESVTVR
ncbi:MAG: exodeoxyribonuclease V subunit gamma, partial [Acidobacteriota bacterium]